MTVGKTTALAVVALAAVAASAFPASAGAPTRHRAVRNVVFVGNNWDGTADVIYPRMHYKRVARINIIPDIDERMAEIASDPERLGYFLAIRQLVGEGHDQFVDDMYSSNSPDGKQVAVSDSTANIVHLLNVRTGKQDCTFTSGDSPHENNYSADGKLIYHASIGRVYTPTDQPEADTSKGERWFEIVKARNCKVLKKIDMGQKLDEAGYPNMASAVRPMALAPGERFVYFQVSFFHGFVEYDLKRDKVTRVANMPIAQDVQDMPREEYLLDSAHHGLAMNGRGTRLCVAGTMSDYAAIVSRKSFHYKLIHGGEKPYWSTTSRNGRNCYVSWSGSDRISVISYKKRKEIARIPVGDHPQRIRSGNVRRSWLRAQLQS